MKRKYWYWINNIEGIGNSKIRRLLSHYEEPEEVYRARERELIEFAGLSEKDVHNILSSEKRNNIMKKYYEDVEKGRTFVFPYEEDYPNNLRELYDRPNILYYKGNLPKNDRYSVAIVGSRRCSDYGRHVAMELSRKLSEHNVNVISGLAMGIDTEAHKGAVYSGGRTYAVLAGGVDRCYPAGNYNLYMDIIRNGGIISEYPEDTLTVPGMFPMRNRIISGLSDAVIIVEAGEKSGSLITAACALEQNRTVYAVPGRIGDPMGKGCNELIAQGAVVITDYNTVLQDMGLSCENTEKNNIGLESNEKMLYSLLLDFTPRSLETIIRESGLDTEEVIKGLICLEMNGYIREKSKNFYVRIR